MRFAPYLLLAALAYGADRNLLDLVMPDARFVSGIHVEKSRNAPFGRYVLAQMRTDDQDLNAFAARAGFDIGRDLTDLVVATAGDSEHQRMLYIGRGSFDPARFASAATAEGGTVAKYAGAELVTHKGAGGETAVAILDGSTAVLGEPELVKSAIDRRGAALPAAVAAKVREVSAANDAWFVSTGPLSEFFTGKLPDSNLGEAVQGNLLTSVQSASGGLTFGADSVKLAGEAVTSSAKDATSLGEVLRFLAGLVQVNKKEQGSAPVTLAQSLELSTADNVLRFSLSLPEAMVEKLFMKTVQQAPPAERSTDRAK